MREGFVPLRRCGCAALCHEAAGVHRRTKGASGFRDQDDMMIVPLNTGMKRVLGKRYLNSIAIETDAPENIDGAREAGLDAVLFQSLAQLRADLGTRDLDPGDDHAPCHGMYREQDQTTKLYKFNAASGITPP